MAHLQLPMDRVERPGTNLVAPDVTFGENRN
jgi:hypothetical protein